MLEFVYNNTNKVLLAFLAVEFIIWTLSFILPKIEDTLSTIGFVLLGIGTSFLFTVAIVESNWVYLFVSIALMTCNILLVKVHTSLDVMESYNKTYDRLSKEMDKKEEVTE